MFNIISVSNIVELFFSSPSNIHSKSLLCGKKPFVTEVVAMVSKVDFKKMWQHLCLNSLHMQEKCILTRMNFFWNPFVGSEEKGREKIFFIKEHLFHKKCWEAFLPWKWVHVFFNLNRIRAFFLTIQKKSHGLVLQE